MITIRPADEAFLKTIAAPAGVDAMVLRDSSGQVFGHALFTVQGEVVELLHAESEEPLLTEGLIRAVLNTGDCRGATTGLCRVESLQPTLQRLEFVPGEDGWTVSIAAFFHGDCHCQ